MTSKTMEKQKVLEAVLSNYKTISEYYPYPTGGDGEDNVIAETDNFNGGSYDVNLKNFVQLIIQLGAATAGYRDDNKTAVKLEVRGLDFPVYCYKYDGKFVITKAINSRAPEPKKVFCNVY